MTSQPPAARADGPAPIVRAPLHRLRQLWAEGANYLHNFAIQTFPKETLHTQPYRDCCHPDCQLVRASPTVASALTAALAEVATLTQENQKLKAEIQTETCPSCGEVCPAGWCGVCHVPIMTDWEKGFQRICEVAAQNLARAEQAEAEVATLKQENEKLKAQHESRSTDDDAQETIRGGWAGRSGTSEPRAAPPCPDFAVPDSTQKAETAASDEACGTRRRISPNTAGLEPADSLTLQQLRAEVVTLHQAHHWQPIETAPKDISPLILGAVGEKSVLGFYSPRRSYWLKFASQGEDRIYPTHWMPLPAAPDPAGLARRAARPQPQPIEEEKKDT